MLNHKVFTVIACTQGLKKDSYLNENPTYYGNLSLNRSFKLTHLANYYWHLYKISLLSHTVVKHLNIVCIELF